VLFQAHRNSLSLGCFRHAFGMQGNVMVAHFKRPAIGNAAQVCDFVLGQCLFGHGQTDMFAISARTPAFDKADFQIIAPGKRAKCRRRAAQEPGKSLIILHLTTRLWDQLANLL
jgi:hypothetical protein